MKKILLVILPLIIIIPVIIITLSTVHTESETVPSDKTESKEESEFDFEKTLTPLSPGEFWKIYTSLQNLHPYGDRFDTGEWISFGPNGFRINNDPAKLYSGKIANIDITGNNILIAAASGGIWKNIFILWGNITDNMPTQEMGAVATSPDNSSVILAGTGELFGSGGSGIGLFKTTDGGLNWSRRVMLASNGDPMGFSRILFDRERPDTVHASTNIGYFRSVNGGDTWTRFTIDLNPQRVISDIILSDPFDTRKLFAVVNKDGIGGGGVYRSTNAGTNWIKCPQLPDSNGNGAISVCTSSSQQMYLYLVNARTGGALGIYKTTNAGLNWTNLNVPEQMLSVLGAQGFHAYACTVAPYSPQYAMVGGVGMLRTTDFGVSWNIVEGVHADIQNFAWQNGNVYCVNDGGVYYSQNAGGTWTTTANTPAITNFNSISLASNSNLQILAGAEHNGFAHYSNTGGNSIWHYRTGADGAGVAIDPNDDNYLYAVNGVYENSPMPFRRFRSTNRGLDWAEIENGIGLNNACSQWYSSIKSDKIPLPFTSSIYAEVCKTVYKSTNHGDLWSDLNCPLKNTGWFIDEDITVARYGDVYSCSTRDGLTQNNKLWVYLVGSSTWVDRTPNFPVFNKLKRISVDPNSDFTIYAAYLGINNPNYKVCKSTNKGVNWVNITGTGLGDVPLVEVLPHPSNENVLYAATERFGMFFTSNGGQQWYPWNNGFPSGVVITDIEIMDSTSAHPTPLMMFVATHGRGVYFKLLDGNPTIGIGKESSIVGGYKLHQNYPNPFNPVTKIKFEIPAIQTLLKDGGQRVTLSIFDVLGKQVALLVNNNLSPGSYTADWDASAFSSGVYYYRLQSGQFIETKKMILLR